MSWKCLKCGAENSNDNANFCRSCGAPHEHPAVTDETSVMPAVPEPNQTNSSDEVWECKQCGTRNSGNVSVCRVCHSSRYAPKAPVRPPVRHTYSNQSSGSGGSGTLKYVLIGVIVVLLGVIGGMALVGQKSDTADKTASSQTVQKSSSSASSQENAQKETNDKNKQLNVEDDGKLPGNADGNEQDAANMLNKYYQSISNRNMQTAYNILSDDMKSHMGSLESFQSGYQTTLSNRISNVSVVSSDPGRVVLSYTLTSRDKMNGGVKVQTFQGTATMSSQSGSWHIVDLSVKKAGEHFE